MIIRYFTILLFAVTFSAFAAQPFQWNWKTENGTLTVTLQTEAGSYAYRNMTSVLLNSRLKLDGSMNLMRQVVKNKPTVGGFYMNPLVGLYRFPR